MNRILFQLSNLFLFRILDAERFLSGAFEARRLRQIHGSAHSSSDVGRWESAVPRRRVPDFPGGASPRACAPLRNRSSGRSALPRRPVLRVCICALCARCVPRARSHEVPSPRRAPDPRSRFAPCAATTVVAAAEERSLCARPPPRCIASGSAAEALSELVGGRSRSPVSRSVPSWGSQAAPHASARPAPSPGLCSPARRTARTRTLLRPALVGFTL
jgi:hypothetical protein